MRICQNCGKNRLKVNQVSHAKNRSKKFLNANIHSATVLVDGKRLHVSLCTKCLRQLKRQIA